MDQGYDVSDYCGVDPLFGTMEDFDALLKLAHSLGLRILLGVVPSHCSSAHPLFQQALEVNLEPARAARYTRADEMHQAFAFAFVKLGWDPAAWASVGTELEAARQAHGAAPSWAMENHDIVRSVTRFGGGALGTRCAAASPATAPGSHSRGPPTLIRSTVSHWLLRLRPPGCRSLPAGEGTPSKRSSRTRFLVAVAMGTEPVRQPAGTVLATAVSLETDGWLQSDNSAWVLRD